MSKYLVHLAASTFATVEVEADTPEAALAAGDALVKEAKLDFRTVPAAFRACALVPGEMRDGVQLFNWVRLERHLTENNGWQWRLGKSEGPAR